MALSLFESWMAEHPDWSDERVVRAIARDLVEEGEAEPPVDVELLASLCGIAEIEVRPEGPSGMLVRRDQGWVASVLEKDGYERRRFTILHEGGHTFMPDFKRGETQYRCKGSRSRVEHLCDIAAAEMLLPARHFRRDLVDAGFGMGAVEELSERYEASLQATALRAVDLAPSPVMLLVLERTHKPREAGREHECEPQLRLQWAHSQGEWPFPLRHKSVTASSVLSRAWDDRIQMMDSVDDVLAGSAGPVEVSAGRYGDKLLALVRRAS